ncbi:hypothetical protein Tco_1353399 [Tanacetum coccineum]
MSKARKTLQADSARGKKLSDQASRQISKQGLWKLPMRHMIWSFTHDRGPPPLGQNTRHATITAGRFTTCYFHHPPQNGARGTITPSATRYHRTQGSRLGADNLKLLEGVATERVLLFLMDDPNMTMEEYIKLKEEKAHRRGRVFNWQTATYGKIRDAPQCKSQVSTPVNDEIDFRISFDESDDEDYTIICDINLFSYKMIPVNNLKTDLENDNEKAGIPSFPPPMPTTSYIDDLDFFNDFENEFSAIVYNDA